MEFSFCFKITWLIFVILPLVRRSFLLASLILLPPDPGRSSSPSSATFCLSLPAGMRRRTYFAGLCLLRPPSSRQYPPPPPLSAKKKHHLSLGGESLSLRNSIFRLQSSPPSSFFGGTVEGRKGLFFFLLFPLH